MAKIIFLIFTLALLKVYNYFFTLGTTGSEGFGFSKQKVGRTDRTEKEG